MRSHLKILFTFFASFSFLASVSQINKFERIYGGQDYDYGNDITQTYDNGYVLTGTTSSFGHGNSDGYILKIDSLGNPIWRKEYGDINIDHFYSIKKTIDSGYVAAGYTNSFGNGGYDMYVVKTDKNGDTVWTKTLGGSNWDFGYCVQSTADGGFIVAGGTYSYGYGSEDVYLIKLDTNGDTLWTKTYGGANEDEARSVQETSDGGYILTGFTKSYGNINGDIYTIKTNNMGDTVWTNVCGQSGSDIGNNIRQTATGDYILAGSLQLTSGINQAFIVKYDQLGDTVYTRQFGAPNDADAFDICEAADGNYLWVGKLKIGSKYNVYFYKTDQSGYYLYASTFGSTIGDDEAKSVELTLDNGFIVAGNSNSFNNGLGDAYVFKTDNNGVSSGTIVNTPIGIKEIVAVENHLMIFPNPADKEVRLVLNETKSKMSTSVDIYNQLGQLQIHLTNTFNKEPFMKVDVSELKNGLYFIKINSGNSTSTARLIVVH